MKQSLFILLAAVFQISASQHCAYDYIIQKKSNHKDFSNNYSSVYNYANSRISTNNQTYYIPVVFHIVYNNDAQNLPDSVILSQLDVLNEDYRRLNENASETRSEFLEFAGDPNIEFFLANVDPNGNTTNGIIHKYTDREEFLMFEDVFSNEITLDEVKSDATGGSDAWDTDRYLNIWICNIGSLDIFGFELGQVFGYAYPPVNVDEAIANLESGPDWPTEMLTDDESVQGVVLHYTAVGRNNPVANEDNMIENNQGRAATHEIGHYLGLRHIWGDAVAFFGDDGCNVDDGIEDTPNAADQAGYICDFTKNTCDSDNFGSSGEDLPDMVENYMDYSPDACLNMFTNGQINVMRNILEISRPNLINESTSLKNHQSNIADLKKELIKKIDILGRESTNKNIHFNIDIYNDGSVKKYMNLNTNI